MWFLPMREQGAGAGWSRRAIVGAAVAITLLLPSQMGYGQDPQLTVKKVLAAWESRQKRFHTVRYSLTEEVMFRKGMFPDGFPKDDFVSTQKLDLALDFDGNRFRKDTEGPCFYKNRSAFVPSVTTQIFDGTNSVIYTPRAANTGPIYQPHPKTPDLVLDSSTRLGQIHIDGADRPAFLAHGVVFMHRVRQDVSHLRVSIAPESLQFQSQAVHEGRACVVVRMQAPPRISINMFDEFWVDLEREGAILRAVTYIEGVLDASVDIRWRKTAHGWLPQGWTFNQYSGNNLNTVRRLQVRELVVNPTFDPQTFRVDMEPGMIVQKLEGTSNKTYRVDPNGNLVELRDDAPEAQHSSGLLWFFATAVVVFLLSWVSVRWWRRRQKRQRSALAS